MIKKLLLPFLGLLIFLFASSSAFAADFQLTHIGTLATEGKNYTSWQYAGLQPTFKGTGTAGASVEIKIDETVATATIAGDGLWTYTPSAALAEGNHQVVLTSGDNTISFTLTLGQQTTVATPSAAVTATTATTTAESLPVAGNLNYTLFLLILGGISFFLGGYFFLKPRSVFIRK